MPLATNIRYSDLQYIDVSSLNKPINQYKKERKALLIQTIDSTFQTLLKTAPPESHSKKNSLSSSYEPSHSSNYSQSVSYSNWFPKIDCPIRLFRAMPINQTNLRLVKPLLELFENLNKLSKHRFKTCTTRLNDITRMPTDETISAHLNECYQIFSKKIQNEHSCLSKPVISAPTSPQSQSVSNATPINTSLIRPSIKDELNQSLSLLKQDTSKINTFITKVQSAKKSQSITPLTCDAYTMSAYWEVNNINKSISIHQDIFESIKGTPSNQDITMNVRFKPYFTHVGQAILKNNRLPKTVQDLLLSSPSFVDYLSNPLSINQINSLTSKIGTLSDILTNLNIPSVLATKILNNACTHASIAKIIQTPSTTIKTNLIQSQSSNSDALNQLSVLTFITSLIQLDPETVQALSTELHNHIDQQFDLDPNIDKNTFILDILTTKKPLSRQKIKKKASTLTSLYQSLITINLPTHIRSAIIDDIRSTRSIQLLQMTMLNDQSLFKPNRDNLIDHILLLEWLINHLQLRPSTETLIHNTITTRINSEIANLNSLLTSRKKNVFRHFKHHSKKGKNPIKKKLAHLLYLKSRQTNITTIEKKQINSRLKKQFSRYEKPLHYVFNPTQITR